MLFKRLMVVLCVLFFSSCANKMVLLKNASAGKVGCPPQQITISDYTNVFLGGMANWTAECKGIKYYCSAVRTTKYSEDFSCAEAK